MGALAATVIAVGVLFVAVFPLQSYRTQRTATVQAEAELAEVRAERARVQREADQLRTDAEIERRAREAGYREPGQELVYPLPSATEPIGLPETWPFLGLESALAG